MWAPGQPARPGRRRQRGRRGVPHLPARRARRRLRRGPGRRVPGGRAADGAVLPREDRADVRARREDLRRLRRPARRRHRAPLGRARPGRRPHARRRRAARKLRRQLYETSFLGMGIMAGPDLAAFLSASRGNLRGLLHATRRVARHVYDLVTRRRGMQLVNGTALAGRLLRSALDLGVDMRVSSPVTELLRDDDGRVTGVVADTPDGPAADHRRPRRRAGRRRLPARRRPPPALFPSTPTGTEHWSLAPKTADGAGITLGESVGGRLRTDVASPAAWCPVSLVPYRDGPAPARSRTSWTAPSPAASACCPPAGASSTRPTATTTTSTAMIAAAPEGEPVQAWQIADARFVRRFPLGMAKPLPVPLFPYLRSGYLKKGRTLEELARGLRHRPATGWTATVAEFNATPAAVWTREFGRGVDPVQPLRRRPDRRPEPVAARRWRRARSTPCGSCPAASARSPGSPPTPAPASWTTTTRRSPACTPSGNDQASVMGGHYPAGGINIGPAMTFGYIAGRDLAPAVAVPRPPASRGVSTDRRRHRRRQRDRGRHRRVAAGGGRPGRDRRPRRRARTRQLDVTDPDAVDGLRDALGPVGILVNSAGVVGPSRPWSSWPRRVAARRSGSTSTARS